MASRKNGDRLEAPAGGCVIRMYRHGLGDCFLLAFGGEGGPSEQRYLLIDCGVLLGTSGAQEMMKKVVADISEATGGHLDVVAVTHEHWDHVSGFAQAGSLSKELEIDELWLAWTEDPSDRLAKKLLKQRETALKALAAIKEHKPAGIDAERWLAFERHLLTDFWGLGATGGGKTHDALEAITKMAKRRVYCTPGMSPLTVGGSSGVRGFVLGPPRDEQYLSKNRPSKKRGESYLTAVQGRFRSFIEGALRLGATAEADVDGVLEPFDSSYKIPVDKIPANNTDLKKIAEVYDDKPTRWRGIDHDWLEAGGELALALDESTNNTSLVLALELTPGGDVLLFPGDAQVGSWLSWPGVTFDLEDRDEPVTGAELLERTVFYKVGHHGSHNATLKENGLELMKHPELMAAIPVNQKTAADRKWKMPYEPLLERLEQKCCGRVAVLDEDVGKSFGSKLIKKKTELYFDLVIEPRTRRTSRSSTSRAPRRNRFAVLAK